MNIHELPPRIPASVVCKLAGYGKGTLAARIRRGTMPSHIDRGKENLFLTSEVLKRLGLAEEITSSINPLERALDALGTP